MSLNKIDKFYEKSKGVLCLKNSYKEAKCW